MTPKVPKVLWMCGHWREQLPSPSPEPSRKEMLRYCQHHCSWRFYCENGIVKYVRADKETKR
jgi:hypothetical protein